MKPNYTQSALSIPQMLQIIKSNRDDVGIKVDLFLSQTSVLPRQLQYMFSLRK